MQSLEDSFISYLQNSGVCANLDDDVYEFAGFCPRTQKSRVIISTDSFCEGIHFKSEWFSLSELTRKAFLVNLSDIFAKNALPRFALLSIVLPQTFTRGDLRKVVDSLQAICREFRFKLIGGDSVVGKKLEFHITLIGETQSNLARKRAKIGSYVFYTQHRIHKIGSSYRQLQALLRSQNPQRAKMRFLEPSLRVEFLRIFGMKLQACMDISDGILQDLTKLLASANLAIRFSKKFCSLKASAQRWRLQSGEEYELLFCVDSRKLRALQRSARIARIDIVEIGRLQRGNFIAHYKKWH